MVGAFDKILHEGFIWNGPIAVLYFILHKSICIHFVHHGTNFYEKYEKSSKTKLILMMMGLIFLQNKRLESSTMQNFSRNMLIQILFLRDII